MIGWSERVPARTSALACLESLHQCVSNNDRSKSVKLGRILSSGLVYSRGRRYRAEFQAMSLHRDLWHDTLEMTSARDHAPSLRTMPPEVLLYIFSFLDLPDLAQLSTISPIFRNLASDKALHRFRVLVVAPSRIRHFLFAQGGSLRPTVGDLVQRGVMRGLGIERRWRHGLYFYSPQSVKQYWTSQRLDRAHVCHSISSLLGSRPTDPLKVHHTARVVLPDVESCSSRISHTLLPVIHQLKWSLQRDRLAKIYRNKELGNSGLKGLFEGKARSLYVEGERVRLAICPGVRRLKSFYEGLSS